MTSCRRRSVLSDLARLFAPLMAVIAVWAILGAAPTSAQEQASPPEAAEPEAPGPELETRTYLDGAAFRALFEGRTIHVTLNGQYYGSEQYLSGDRAVWTMLGEPCQRGFWTYDEPLICFTYEASPTSCWTVFESEGSYYAESVEGRLLLKIASVSDEPLNCAPDLLS